MMKLNMYFTMANNKEEKNEINVSFEKFARHVTPLPTESKEKSDDKMVKWGEFDNVYPNFLIDLASKSAIHGSILNSKSNYIFGDGIIDKKSKEFFGEDFNINSEYESLAELMRKAINDLVYFNAFAIKVEFNLLGEPLHYSHIPLHHVRLNKSKTKVFVNQDWFNNPRTYMSYDRYNPKVQYEDTNAKVFYFSSYTVSVNNIYPTPDYNPAIESAVIDGLVNELFKNNVANGFSLQKIIHVFGSTDEDTKRKFSTKMREVLTGVDGDGFTIDWFTDKDKQTTIDTIPSDDYASKLIEVIKKAERNILSAHSATSSLLFGVEKEGSLGNATELENAFQLFKDNYVKDKRGEIVGAFNRLFTNDDRLPVIDLKDREKLFKTELQSSTKEKVMTINELRLEAGLDSIEGGDRLLLDTEVKPQPFYTANNQFSKKKDDEEVEGYFATAEDFEKVKHLGTDKSQFITLSQSQFSECGHYHFSSNYNSIEEYLLNNKVVGLTLDEIASKIQSELGYNVSKVDVQQAMDLLKNAGLIDSKINTKTGIIHTAPSANIQGNKVEVYYDYVKRPEAEGAIKIPTTRHFCESVIDSNKYFSAMDIMSFSSALGYDCMSYGGGWWKNKATGEVNKHCRHEWKPVRVIKK